MSNDDKLSLLGSPGYNPPDYSSAGQGYSPPYSPHDPQRQEYTPYLQPGQNSIYPQVNELPPGWYKYVSPEGYDYYYNTATMTTQWEHPITGIAQNPYLLPQTVPIYTPIRPWEDNSISYETASSSGKYTDGNEPVWNPTDPNNPYNMDKQAYDINNRVDANGNPILDEQQIRNVPRKIFPIEAYSRTTSWKQAIMGTYYGAKFLSYLSISMCGLSVVSIVLFIILLLVTHSAILPVFIPAVLPYPIYILCFGIPGLFCWIFQCCCHPKPPCLDFNPFAVMCSCGSRRHEDVTEYMERHINSTPSLSLYIECYHYVTKIVKDKDGKKRTERKRVTTYTKWKAIPIIRHRDISVPSTSVLDGLYTCPSSMIVAEYIYDYEMHPLQQDLFKLLKHKYYQENRWRDQYCDVSSHYSTTEKSRLKYKLLIQRKSLSYCLSVAFLNPISLLLLLLLPFSYLGGIILSNKVYKRMTIPLVKYIHIGIPQK